MPPISFADAMASIDVQKLLLLPRKEREQAHALLAEAVRRESRRRFFRMFPDKGPLRRELYPKHLEFFGAGKTYTERCAMAANRVGKTQGMGAYETTCHLTGRYPDWWPGHRFDRAIDCWACGKTNETTRDIVQRELFGKVIADGARKSVDGTGMIPGDDIDTPSLTWRQGVPDAIDTVRVRHVSGDWSVIGLKSYQQGRGSFEGTAKDWIWDDEEPPADVYGEQMMRLMTTHGLFAITFTPLEGLSEVVLSFLPTEYRPGNPSEE